MKRRVVVWGTGNVGRPALRAVLAHRDLELAGVVVANPAKIRRDAGEIAGLAPLGVRTTADARQLLGAGGLDASRPVEEVQARVERRALDLAPIHGGRQLR